MKKYINHLPLPICCTALGFAGLGILLKGFHPLFMALCGMISFSIIGSVFLKLIFIRGTVGNIFSDPVQFGAFAAFPMTFMLLSLYISDLGIPLAARIVWCLALILHTVIILIFSLRYVRGFQIENVHGTWFLVYIGIAASSIAAPAHKMQAAAAPFLFFSLMCLPFLLALAVWRYLKYPVASESQKPLFCILAAPVSLCLSGYLQSSASPSPRLTAAMLMVSVILYIIAAGRLCSLIFKRFYPSHAAFTFPFVISASAMKQSITFLETCHYHFKILPWIQTAETLVAIFLCIWVLGRFILFIKNLP